jgi:hypothetical protein
MASPGVWVRFEEEIGGWRIYWSGTFDLADARIFDSIEEAGPVMVELMTKRPPQLRVIRGGKEEV